MKNPKVIKRIDTHIYEVPQYEITNDGIIDCYEATVRFAKGSKDNPELERKSGFFTESLIQLCKEHLESVNVGELSSRETSLAITKLQEALFWLDARRQDRELRNVLSTYKK
jgi:hypothetical protein